MTSSSWDEVMATVRKDDVGKWDTEEPAECLSMGDEGDLVVRDGRSSRSLSLSEHAFTQLCGKLEVPSRYLRRLPDRIRAQCVNYELLRARIDSRSFLVRCKGESVRAILSARYTSVDNFHLLETVERLARGYDHQVHSFHLGETGMWLKIVFNDLGVEDPSSTSTALKLGLVIGNSEVGCRAVTIEPLVYRLACLNDAIIRQEGLLNQRHVGIGAHEIDTNVAKAVDKALKVGDTALEKFLGAHERQIENPVEVIKKLSENRGLSRANTDSVLMAFEAEPQNTQLGVVNAFTRAAKDMDEEASIDFERFAGSLLAA